MVVAKLYPGTKSGHKIPYEIRIYDDPFRSPSSAGPYDIVLTLDDTCHGYEVPAGAPAPDVSSSSGITRLVWKDHAFGDKVPIVVVCKGECAVPVRSHLEYSRGHTIVVDSEDWDTPCASQALIAEHAARESALVAASEPQAVLLQQAFERGFRLGLDTGLRLGRELKKRKSKSGDG